MEHIDVQFICQSIKEPFKDFVKVMQEEMKTKAFTTTDYDTLRIEYAFLDKLVQRMENEAIDEITTGGE